MAASELGIGAAILNTAFIFGVGACAVAFAIAFGLGGRKVAEEASREWYERSQSTLRGTRREEPVVTTREPMPPSAQASFPPFPTTRPSVPSVH
jgi:hypothetical protein